MAERTAAERRLLEKAAQYFPGGNNGNLSLRPEQQFLVAGGQGSRVWDVSGNEYIDWLMGSGPMALGHAHPRVVEAVIRTVEQGSTFFATADKAVLLAEELAQAIPCADKVRFTTSGTDACFQAMRAARAYTGKEKILKFEGGYHGSSDYAMMSVFASGAEEFPQAERNGGGIPQAIADLMLIAPFNDLATTTAIVNAHHEELAAVIVEPLQRIIAPQPGFLPGLRELCTRHRIPLIFDEVVTGFRLAYGGAQEFYGVTPDLCSIGKVMGGGYPLAAVLGRDDLMAAFDSQGFEGESVMQVGTLNGNPVACAAGLATLEVLREEGAYQRLHGAGAALRQAMTEICREQGVPVQDCGEDAVFDFCFTDRPVQNYRDARAGDGTLLAALNAGLLERGIFKGGQKYYPSAVHTQEDIDRTIEAYREIVPTLRG